MSWHTGRPALKTDVKPVVLDYLVRTAPKVELVPCTATLNLWQALSRCLADVDFECLMSQHALTQEKEVAPVIADYWEHAAFPFELVPRMAKLNLGGATIKGYGCPGQSVLGTAMAVIEIARVDASMSTFIMVHNSLAMLTIGRVSGLQTFFFHEDK